MKKWAGQTSFRYSVLAMLIVGIVCLAPERSGARRIGPQALTAADQVMAKRASERYGSLPISFEANRGQTDRDVKFLSRGHNYGLFLARQGATLQLSGAPPLQMKFIAANPAPAIEGVDQLPGKSNYLIGNDPLRWRTDVPNYAKVRYASIYPGVDVVFYGDRQKLEYDFIVAPGANPAAIKMAFDGAEALRIDGNGDLIVRVAGVDVRQRRPGIYQETNGARREIAGGYRMTGPAQVGFEVAEYDTGKALVIDPVIAYSARGFGGSGVAVDAEGAAYVFGLAATNDFPSANRLGTPNIFIAKLNPSGTGLIYTTYFGGNGSDSASAIAVDQAGNVFLAGTTDSTDLPGASNSFAGSSFFKTTDGGSHWVAGNIGTRPVGINKLIIDPKNPATIYAAGVGVVYKSTDAGRSWTSSRDGLPANSEISALAINPANTSILYVGTFSEGIFKSTDGGASWVAKGPGPPGPNPGARHIVIDPTNPAVLYLSDRTDRMYKSEDIGETWTEIKRTPPLLFTIRELAIDPANPNTLYAGAYFPGAISKSTDGGATWNLITTGLPETVVNSIAISPANSLLLYVGTTHGIYKSTDGGATWNASNNGFPLVNAGDFFNFPIVIDPATPSTLYAAVTATTQATGIYESTDGGASWNRTGDGLTNIDVNALAIDPLNPSTVYAGANAQGADAFALKLNQTGSGIIYSRYLGGSYVDMGTDLAVDGAGNAYIVGYTLSDNFPVTQNAFQPSLRGGRAVNDGDVFVTRLDASGSISYSTYLGGDGDYDPNRPWTSTAKPHVAVDPAGAAYVTGVTSSKNFPLKNPLPPSGGGFLAKINPSQSGDASLVYSTLIGEYVPIPYSRDPNLAVDASGNVYLLSFDGQVGKLNAEGTRFIYSTRLSSGPIFIGGINPPPGEGFNSIAVDSSGALYIAGFTINKNFPVTPNAPQPRNTSGTCALINGSPINCSEALVLKLAPSGLVAFSTFLGGTNSEVGNDIKVDSGGNIYVAGTTGSADFPVTSGAVNLPSAGFLTKIAADESGATVASTSAASYSRSALARESIAAAFGMNWTAVTESATSTLPTSLAGVKLRVRDSAAVERFAPLFFVSPNQINYQIPPGTANGNADLTVFYGNVGVAAGTVEVMNVAPGLFAANANGQGVAAAVALRVKADGSQTYEPVARLDAAQNRFVAVPVDLGVDTDQVFLSLFGTGWRFRSPESVVTVKIGGAEAPLTYAGAQPSFVGLDQINVRLPRELAGRGKVDVVVTVDGKTANVVKVIVQ